MESPYLYAPRVRLANAGSDSVRLPPSEMSAPEECEVVTGISRFSPEAVFRTVAPDCRIADDSIMCSHT